MNNSTLYRLGSVVLTFAQAPKAICLALFSRKNYCLAMAGVLLLLSSIGNKASGFATTYYYPVSATAGTGGTYCVGTPASTITGTIFTTSASAVGGTSSTVSWAWYYNTSGAVGTLAGATLAFSGTSYIASAASFSANLPGASISTLTGGTYYYFLYVTNSGGTTTAPDIYSNLSTVVVGAGTLSGPTLLCAGSLGSFTSTVPGGTWASSAPGVASISGGGLATGLTQGTTTLTYTAGGCTSTTVLSVNAIPTPISGTLSACPGTTTSLSEFAFGGTWSSSLPGIAIITPAGLVTGVSPGTTTIMYSNGCGVPATAIVTINPYPAAITGPDTVCEGASITLNSITGGGTWNSSLPSIATADLLLGVVGGVAAGTADISYTLLGCTVSKTVTVDPLPAPISGLLKECVTGTTTLGNAIPGGTWSSTVISIATIDAAGVVTGLVAGTTIISYTNGCGSVTAIDTVVAIPDSIVGRDTTCLGNTTTFADVVLDGIWTSSDTSVASVLTGSGIITGEAAGSAIITYTVPPGCFTTRMVRVLPLPLAIGGPSRVCIGNTITLTNAATGTWSSAQSFIASVGGSTGVVTGIMADTANIIFTNRFGCAISKTITVNPSPAQITGGITRCGLSVDTVYDATPSGVWSVNPPTVATISSSGIISTLSGGTAIVSYTLATGCRATKVLTVNSLPAAVVVYNFAINSFMTDTFYASYQWYSTLQGAIPGANSFRTAALYDGDYWVVVTDSNGCTAASMHLPYLTSMVGVKNPAAASLHIYPNPATNIVHIEAGISVRAVITSLDGKTEMDQADAKELNIGSLANGMYFISVYDENGARLTVQKLIKQ